MPRGRARTFSLRTCGREGRGLRSLPQPAWKCEQLLDGAARDPLRLPAMPYRFPRAGGRSTRAAWVSNLRLLYTLPHRGARIQLRRDIAAIGGADASHTVLTHLRRDSAVISSVPQNTNTSRGATAGTHSSSERTGKPQPRSAPGATASAIAVWRVSGSGFGHHGLPLHQRLWLPAHVPYAFRPELRPAPDGLQHLRPRRDAESLCRRLLFDDERIGGRPVSDCPTDGFQK